MSGDNPIARLRAAALALRRAARAECIEPDGPLGVWVEAQDQALTAQADVAEHQERLITGVLGGVDRAAAAQLSNCERVLAAAQHTERFVTVQAQEVTSRMIMHVTPKLVAGVQQALVIRERRHNEVLQLWRAAGIAVAVLALLIGGYVWRWSQEGDDVVLAARVRSAIQHCQDTSQWFDDQGRQVCLLADFLPPALPPLASAQPTVRMLDGPLTPAPTPAPTPPAPAAARSSNWPIVRPGEPVRFHD